MPSSQSTDPTRPEHLDHTASAAEFVRLLAGTDDDALDDPTPCADWTVAELLAHAMLFSAASAAAATGEPFGTDAPEFSGGLPDDWRAELPRRIERLADVWRDSPMWEQMTDAGGVQVPGEEAGRAALQELVLHGWDLARATGQDYRPDDAAVSELLTFIGGMAEEDRSWAFHAQRPVDARASALDRLLTLSGRDPGWLGG